MPPRSRSALTSITSGFCASFSRAAICCGRSITPPLSRIRNFPRSGRSSTGSPQTAPGVLLRAFSYPAVIEDQEFSSIRPLIDWLDYNGYTVVTKPTKEFVDQTGRRKIKGNMDIELAVDAMELAGHIDHMVLFSGDGDFRSLVEAVQRRGVRVSVVSTTSTQPPMIADELRRQADIFLDIVELQSKIGRD